MNNNEKFLNLRKRIIEKDFSRMNDMQRMAVFQTEGPLLVLAGAGSGKTTVLVNRIANMMKYGNAYHSNEIYCDVTEELLDEIEDALLHGISAELARKIAVKPVLPWQILSITFTNKAAGEMKERLETMLGEKAFDIKSGTFHSICARMLRRNAERLGYTSSFTIYDTADMKRLIKDAMGDLNIDSKQFDPKGILSKISGAKNQMQSPESFANTQGHDYYLKTVAKIYEKYQEKIKNSNAMDFDDLLLNTVKLFQENDDILEYYQNRIKYIMVDEYQDTNLVQYEFIRLLSEKSQNICVVGDDDQSIYKFRGATIENILSFEKTFKEGKVIRLEQNYRSTQNILDAANGLIKNNKERKGKNLWTDEGEGDKILYSHCTNQDDEARFVANQIERNVVDGSKYSDNAVLYRMNAQSNAIESYFVRAGVPYRMIGGHKFYDRAEIKDIIAYMKVIINPSDVIAFKRIINTPKRGIGNATIEKVELISEHLGDGFFEVLKRGDEFQELSRAGGKLCEFANMISYFSELAETESPSRVYNEILSKTGYMQYLERLGEEGKTKSENVMELLSNIIKYEESNDDPTIYGFLEEVSLLSDIDNYDADADAVVMMTIHSAKGLEFENTFIVGLEEGIFPSDRSRFEGESEIEEERRTAYVAYTRAKKKLCLTTAGQRFMMGRTEYHQPSRFFKEIPSHLIDDQSVVIKNTFPMGNAQKPAKPYFQSASAFVQKDSKKETASCDFLVGERLLHPTFKEGTLLKITPMGNDILLEIAFDSVGTKKVMMNYVKLQKI